MTSEQVSTIHYTTLFFLFQFLYFDLEVIKSFCTSPKSIQISKKDFIIQTKASLLGNTLFQLNYQAVAISIASFSHIDSFVHRCTFCLSPHLMIIPQFKRCLNFLRYFRSFQLIFDYSFCLLLFTSVISEISFFIPFICCFIPNFTRSLAFYLNLVAIQLLIYLILSF